MDFFLEANPEYEQVGARPTNIAQTGVFDNSEVYDATYANINEWGNARWNVPGMVIEGKLVTTNLTDINVGFEEFIEHSFYDDWTRAPSPGSAPTRWVTRCRPTIRGTSARCPGRPARTSRRSTPGTQLRGGTASPSRPVPTAVSG